MARKKSKKSPLPKFIIAIVMLLLALAVLTGIGARTETNTADSGYIDENIPEISEFERYINIIISFIGDTVNGNNAEVTDTITVGSFNIQVFGQSKASDDEVMTTLANIIRNFDIIAIQEIRDSSETAAPLLLQYVNADGSDYDMYVGERLGRTTSKEQYAFIYNTDTIRPAGDPVTYPDSEYDMFHREPYIMPFETTGGDFTATYAVIHTDPDEAKEEIPALTNVMEYMEGVLPGDDTLILMGDLNADCTYFDEDSYITLKSGEYQWLIGNSEDTTTGNTVCTYDRIILNGGEEYYTGNSGVFRFDSIYGLSQDESLKVSDHYPVYAKFKTSGDGTVPAVSSRMSESSASCSGDSCMQESEVMS
ncbi:endonuclease/exonuclease/phosphatase family protein [Methanoplanus endosymbiosus]|uniref:Endonuclease/exonuclease/phosphatase family protein n=1 Tax=Methanoplanus endosymbiosus TaxID=33865 RepID=A0A9E7PR85_9EURY|nr:endonuclease/exonuclease/phosphatase family protein [Methanoplanus endosymbiosus]UUX92047.1 endonuclease/exonuclease/phosphatase family protein [Methanoplanus endosymbiosus]